jgi:predicted DNA-binding transcriptional regulator AlpA
MSSDNGHYYNFTKVNEITGLTLKRVKELIGLRLFPRYVMLGRLVFWKKEEIDQWMDDKFHW